MRGEDLIAFYSGAERPSLKEKCCCSFSFLKLSRTHYVTQADLRPTVSPLLQPPECWCYTPGLLPLPIPSAGSGKGRARKAKTQGKDCCLWSGQAGWLCMRLCSRLTSYGPSLPFAGSTPEHRLKRFICCS